MESVFRLPNAEEAILNEKLVGRVISIYWDGDSTYFPCEVISFKEERNTYVVRYFGSDNEITEEKLTESIWLIWTGTKSDYISRMEKDAKVELVDVEVCCISSTFLCIFIYLLERFCKAKYFHEQEKCRQWK